MLNLALNRPATQSSTSRWSTDPNPETDARVANNGDLFELRWCHTDHETNPWWQVDLGDAFLIERVDIHNRPDVKDRLKYFTLLRSNDGQNWIEFFGKADSSAFVEFSCEIKMEALGRFIRLRLDGTNSLHIRECQIFGKAPSPEARHRLLAEDARFIADRSSLPNGRKGHFSQIGGFRVFVDEENYGPDVRRAIDAGNYEGRERTLASTFLRPDDRVLEIGTAIGAVSMTAAAIVGPANVVTFDANPDIVADARENFQRNGLGEIKSNVGVLTCERRFKAETYAEFYISREFWASRLVANEASTDIIKTVKIPVKCLEHEISAHRANVLICDIEGGEVDLLNDADLSGIRMIIMETHYWAVGEAATDAMMRNLILQGLSIDLAASGGQISVLRRS